MHFSKLKSVRMFILYYVCRMLMCSYIHVTGDKKRQVHFKKQKFLEVNKKSVHKCYFIACGLAKSVLIYTVFTIKPLPSVIGEEINCFLFKMSNERN